MSSHRAGEAVDEVKVREVRDVLDNVKIRAANVDDDALSSEFRLE